MEIMESGVLRTERNLVDTSTYLFEDVQFAVFNPSKTKSENVEQQMHLPNIELVSSINDQNYMESQPMDLSTAIEGMFIAENGSSVQMREDSSMFMSVPGVGTASFSADGTITIKEIGETTRTVRPIRADSFRGHVVYRYPENSGVGFAGFTVLPGSGGASFTAKGIQYSFSIARDKQSVSPIYTGTFEAKTLN